jgi:hypothetical protein
VFKEIKEYDDFIEKLHKDEDEMLFYWYNIEGSKIPLHNTRCILEAIEEMKIDGSNIYKFEVEIIGEEDVSTYHFWYILPRINIPHFGIFILDEYTKRFWINIPSIFLNIPSVFLNIPSIFLDIPSTFSKYTKQISKYTTFLSKYTTFFSKYTT